jgi:integrase
VINDNQLIKLIDYSRQNLNKKQLLIILLLISTGIRRNELVNIKIANIEFDKKIWSRSYFYNKFHENN